MADVSVRRGAGDGDIHTRSKGWKRSEGDSDFGYIRACLFSFTALPEFQL